MITDQQIQKALRNVERSGRQSTIYDGEGKGTGRLALIIKPMPTRVTADWYAQQWAGGRRRLVKIGSYPAMPLAQARELFQRDFSGAIQKGASIKAAGDSRPGTVADLFSAYVDHLQDSGKPSWKEVEKGLNKVAGELGSNRLARDVDSDDVLAVLRPIYERGSRAMADHVRSYIRSSYSWGMRSERDYRSTSPRRFRIRVNPAADIPTEPKVAGTRWLDENDWCRLYRWLENPSSSIHPPYARALRVLLLTGQRVQEIAALHADQYDPQERMIDWSKTKNGKPHSIPLPALAADLLDGIKPNRHGWLFPSATDPERSVSHGTLYSFIWRQRGNGVIPHVSNRDLRRTWKTLAGKAGLSKEVRDRIQNHTLQDVSSKVYDRYTYLTEKRQAMDRWNDFVVAMLNRVERNE